MGEWINHDGGACPVTPHQIVVVRLRDGWTDENLGGSEADGWEWLWRQDADDIVAYRTTTPSPRPQHGGGAE